ncbi:MAG: hypothetical protein GY809_32535 [Planctomycetes bacterium]|nr:hypothetical protein [Planctomycetota bacterium]
MIHSQNRLKILTSLAFVVSMAFVLCLSLGAKSSSRQTSGFEYKVISRRFFNKQMFNQSEQKYPEVQAKVVEEALNDLGKKGWELQDTNESFFFLKRRLP